jgi:quercetin dioxygenase-like cupin family protein
VKDDKKMDQMKAENVMSVVDTNSLPWEEIINEMTGKKFIEKKLCNDPDTGMMVNFSKYPAGYITPWHVHDCSHGIYVLEGTLYTQDGCYNAGSYVWYPEGSFGEHGATKDGDVTVLFITNKKFSIRYLERK